MSRRKTQEEFILEIKELVPSIVVLGTYKNRKTPIDCYCTLCKKPYTTTPSSLLAGHGHSECFNKISAKKRTKSNDDFLNELREKTDTLIPLEEYTGVYNKIKVLCTECNNPFDVTPHSLLNGTGCPICGKKKAGLKQRKTNEQFLYEMGISHPELVVNSEYTTSWEKVSCTCKNCGKTFDVNPADILYKKGCPRCNIENLPQRQPKPFEQFKKELYKVNPNIEIIGEYKKQSDHIMVKCKVCKNEWSPIGTSLLQGFGCPICCISHGEKRIDRYLHENNIEHTHQKDYDGLVGVGGGLLSYDFYLPKENILIEYQGEYHDGTANNQTKEQFEKQQIHDKLKKEYTINNNIQLLEIWYWDYDNIETILNSIL